jgi:threonine aldolase
VKLTTPGFVKMGSLGIPDAACGRLVDFRSDTVTKPTDAMRAAMAIAEVDDDVQGGDPTITQLQNEIAHIMGKEAGLFVPSGTMGNLIAVLVHCDTRGSEVIMGTESHISVYEQGGVSTLGGVHPRTVPNNSDGTMDLSKLEAAIRYELDDHFPITRLICLENTQARCGGRCISAEYTDKVGELAKSYGLQLHIDGARIFNASVALGVAPERLVRAADTVSVCLSKGLGAPVGTVLVGSNEFIIKARRLRKALGGGMRQVGILGAAGLVALRDMVDRLAVDHANARLMAEGLNAVKGLRVDMSIVETNIVYAEVTTESALTPKEIVEAWKKYGVLTLTWGRTIRVVTHYHITEDDVRFALRFFDTISLQKNLECSVPSTQNDTKLAAQCC